MLKDCIDMVSKYDVSANKNVFFDDTSAVIDLKVVMLP